MKDYYPQIGDTPVWILPNVWRLGQVRDTKFITDVSNKKVNKCCKMSRLQILLFLSYYEKTSKWSKISPPPTHPGKEEENLIDLIEELNFTILLATIQLVPNSCFNVSYISLVASRLYERNQICYLPLFFILHLNICRNCHNFMCLKQFIKLVDKND